MKRIITIIFCVLLLGCIQNQNRFRVVRKVCSFNNAIVFYHLEENINGKWDMVLDGKLGQPRKWLYLERRDWEK